MKSWRNPLAAIVGLVMLVGSLSVVTPAPGFGEAAKDVQVVNTPNVNVVNTPNVSVVNTPSVNVANTPTVELAGAPSVTVANLPGPGVLYNEVFSVAITGCCTVVSAPGRVVPAGTRRTITHVSGALFCPTGQNALVWLHSSVGSIFLPATPAYKSPTRDFYAMLNQVNVPQRPGSAFQAIMEGAGVGCEAQIHLAGIEVPE